MLIILSGLPATGKTTIARPLARRIGAAHLRVDTVEQAVVDAGLADHPVGVIGYTTCHRLALDQLQVGLSVIADSVNPLEVTRNGWHGVAEAAGTAYLDVEIVCSDVDGHRRRAEERQIDIPGLTGPDWNDISRREYDPWTTDRVVVDTANRDVDECVDQVVAALPSCAAASDR